MAQNKEHPFHTGKNTEPPEKASDVDYCPACGKSNSIWRMEFNSSILFDTTVWKCGNCNFAWKKSSRLLFRTPKWSIYNKPNFVNEAEETPDSAIKHVESKEGKSKIKLDKLSPSEPQEIEFVCKKCKEEVSRDAEKCPHCGYYPGGGGKGALWHGTALATSFTPIGWAMMAKGASDELKSKSGVAEERKK